MSRRRHLAVGVAVLAVASLTLGAGGFTSTAAERDVQVAVVGDGQAYLGVQAELECGTHPLLFNQFPGDTALTHVRIDVAVTDGELRVGKPGEPADAVTPGAPTELTYGGDVDPVDSGEAVSVRVTPHGNATVSESVRVAVDAEGPAVSVAMNRTVDVACTSGDRGRGGNGNPSGQGKGR